MTQIVQVASSFSVLQVTNNSQDQVKGFEYSKYLHPIQ